MPGSQVSMRRRCTLGRLWTEDRLSEQVNHKQAPKLSRADLVKPEVVFPQKSGEGEQLRSKQEGKMASLHRRYDDQRS